MQTLWSARSFPLGQLNGLQGQLPVGLLHPRRKVPQLQSVGLQGRSVAGLSMWGTLLNEDIQGNVVASSLMA